MKKYAILVLCVAIMLYQCACNLITAPDLVTETSSSTTSTQGTKPAKPKNTTVTLENKSTTVKTETETTTVSLESTTVKPETTAAKPSDTATKPISKNADPVGTYRCTGIAFDNQRNYQSAGSGELYIYDNGTGNFWVQEIYAAFEWRMDGERFIAATDDTEPIPMEGTLHDDIVEVVYGADIYLRFQRIEQEELNQEALNSIRDLLEASDREIAVAYLGRMESNDDVQKWISRSCTGLLQAYPMIEEISDGRIIGKGGEVYCLVTRDPKAQVQVSRMDAAEQIVYQGADGAPILVLCNDGDTWPDTKITVVDSAGEKINWCPQIGSLGAVVLRDNDQGEPVMLDFSDYFEVYPYHYKAWRIEGWELSEKEHLSATCWIYYEDIDPSHRWTLNLSENGNAQMDLNVDGEMNPEKHFEGTWHFEHSGSDDLTCLVLDMTCDSGENIQGEYVVLEKFEDNRLLIGIHGDEGVLPVPASDTVSFWEGSAG